MKQGLEFTRIMWLRLRGSVDSGISGVNTRYFFSLKKRRIQKISTTEQNIKAKNINYTKNTKQVRGLNIAKNHLYIAKLKVFVII